MRINKATINYILNWSIFLIGLLNFITGVMRFSKILGFIVIRMGPIDTNLLNTIHRWSGLAVGILILVHIILHWRWIVAMSKKYLGLSDVKK